MPSPTFHVRDLPVYGDAILSPMDGYSDLPFRSLCRELGSAMSYTEFVNVDDILQREDYVAEKLAYTENERPVVFQLYGDDPDKIVAAARRVRELGPDIIDLNMGCPAKSISHRGAGVGLMRTPHKIADIFARLSRALDIPVTGKIRLGWDDDSRNYLEVAKIVQDHGGQLLAVHGRTKKQGFRGTADWEAIAEIVEALAIPVIGNGDVNTAADIERIRARTGCPAAMIGRAAISNPWIFAGLEREQVPPPMVQETMLRHLEKSLSFYGSERGLVLFRKFAARYLAPFRLPKEIRQRLLTSSEAGEFVRLLDEILAESRPAL